MKRGKSNKLVTVAAAVVLAAAVLRLFLFFRPSPPPIDPRAHQRLGEVLAAEALQQLPSGGRLIVLARELSEFQVPAAAAQLEGFLGAVKKSGQAPVTVRPVKVDPLRALAVPPGEFFDLLRQAKDGDVFVSFLGPPDLAPDQVGKLGEKRPKVLAACTGALPDRVNLERVFEQKLLAVAIVSQPGAPAVPGPGDAQRAFDEMYKVITPANLAELPSVVRAREGRR